MKKGILTDERSKFWMGERTKAPELMAERASTSKAPELMDERTNGILTPNLVSYGILRYLSILSILTLKSEIPWPVSLLP